MHKVVRIRDGQVVSNEHFALLPHARSHAKRFGGTVWYYCPTHGWTEGELCRKTHKRRG